MYGEKNSILYSIAGELTNEEKQKHIEKSVIGKLICVTSSGTNDVGREYACERTDGTDDYMLLFVNEGKVLVDFSQSSVIVKERELIIVPPKIPYSFKPFYGTKTKWIHFLGDAFLKQFGIETNRVYKIQETIGINRLFRLCLEQINSSSPIKHDMLSLLGAEIIGSIAESVNKLEKKENDGMEMAINAMKASFKSSVSIEEFADIAGYSHKVFARRFKKKTGKTPKEYIIDLRMEKITEYMLTKPGSIVDIALNHGYNNYEYFIKAFKKRTGLTPSQYRRKFK